MRIIIWIWFVGSSLIIQSILGCLPTEFTCESGQCIDGARFCDGTTDCGDGTDEHHGCTNCNRTYYGMSGIKYSLRLNEPVRQSGSMCTLSFIAAGEIYGDFVEITFLSFHIGVFQLESAACHRGYMEVEDSYMYSVKKRSARYLRRSRKKGTTPRKESFTTRNDRSSLVGSFCGKMIGKSATFYSYGDKVHLNIFMSSQMSSNTAAPRLYLTYRFLRKNTRPPDRAESGDKDTQKDYCNQTLIDCHTKNCVIKSPNYPGFYLRNVSCLYRVKQDSSPTGYIAQIEVFQENEFKINILNGHTSNDKYKSGVVTSDCNGDVIRIYDGGFTTSPLLADFCGSGPLPVIRSSGPEMLVELRSVPFQPLTSSRFELDVRIKFVPKASLRMVSDRCDITIDAGRVRTGVIEMPEHSIAANTSCTFRVSGRKPSDRIWLYFVVYSVPDLHPWGTQERCDVARMKIIYPKLKFRHRHQHRYRAFAESSHNVSSIVGTFCEKTSPLQCGHSSDFEDFVPDRPCSSSTESYLSTGPEMLLELNFLKAMAMYGLSPYFVARYELVDLGHSTSSDGCSLHIRSSEGTTGWLENPQNLFLYGRGGNTNLSCHYELHGKDYERVRITLQKVHFLSAQCETTYHSQISRYNCALPRRISKYALINVTETWKDLKVAVGCICAEKVDAKDTSPLTMESVGNHVNLHFEIRNMGPKDDYRTFHFEIMYEFVASSGCDTSDYSVTGVEGHVTLNAVQPIRCRWLLVSLPSRALYITVKGQNVDESCQNKYFFYELYNQEPYAAYCASENEAYESVFTKSWTEDESGSTSVPETGLTLMEIVAQQPGSFNVHWIEVTRRSTNFASRSVPFCELECPELKACISADLACDGTSHCPETAADEAPERCVQFPIVTVVSSSVAVFVVVIVTCLLAVVVRQHVRARRKSAVSHLQPPPSVVKRTVKELAI